MDTTGAVKRSGGRAQARSRKQRLLVGAGSVMGIILIFAVLLVLAAADTASRQRGVPLGNAFASVKPDAGSIAEIFLGSFFQIALLGFLVLAIEVAVHEGGHVLGGKLAGFRFVMLLLGPLKIVSTRDGIRIKRSDRHDPRTGAALSLPTTADNLRLRMAVTTLAGPLSNLALWPVCWWLSGVTQGAAGTFFALASAFSLFIGVANFLPVRSGGLRSDGARLKLLATGGPQTERFCYVALVAGASRMGKRPRQWDPDWIGRVTGTDDQTLDDATACHVAFYWSLDRGDVDGAERYLDRLLAAIGPVATTARPVFFADAAFFYAYYRHDPCAARRFLDAIGEQHGQHRHMWLRAEAATRALEGNPAGSLRLAREGLDDINRNPPIGPGWELDREWMQALAMP